MKKTRHIEISIKDENKKVLFSSLVNIEDIRKIEEINLDLIFMKWEDELYLRNVDVNAEGGEEIIYLDPDPLTKKS